ncbi:LysE family transporter [Lichenihabitans sp. Uapishka_5]|uniref:LysE family translocator n=1 Tax=Lichenihabitans sp. Uapishka_5 TaxID=3037302 RepID=UPI0029E81CEB|nr:LysE family transporter [Lichenihabitans sp. Uapishka_5]MDX7953428.1 LysE family transporter [Lichenihabitans sp. Uapishka_5]
MGEAGATLPAEIAAFAAAYTNVILIPGPSFVVVCEAGLSTTRREASLVAVGVACGAGVLATTILQAAPVLRTSPELMSAGRVGCALILLVMGLKILCHSLMQARKAGQPGSSDIARTRFMTGFIAAATNPVSFASFTAAALAVRRTEHGDCFIVAVMIFLMALAWFSTLAFVFSRPFLTVHYNRAARTLGSVMGCVLMVKAVSFLMSAL